MYIKKEAKMDCGNVVFKKELLLGSKSSIFMTRQKH